MLTLSDWINLAVAAGTLGATAVAVAEMMAARRERQRALGRELAEKLYIPALRECDGWTQTQTFAYADLISIGALRAFRKEHPHLLPHIPSHLVKSLDDLEIRFQTYQRAKTAAYRLSEALTSGASEAIAPGTAGSAVRIILRSETTMYAGATPYEFWRTQTDPDTWARTVRANSRDDSAQLELLANNRSISLHVGTMEFYRKFEALMGTHAAALAFRQAQSEMRDAVEKTRHLLVDVIQNAAR